MGTWDTGPFDNDSAADWCGALDDAAPGERLAMIRQALTEAADTTGFLDDREGVRAIAAAAIVLSQRPGAEPLTSAYAPDFLLDGGSVVIPDDVAALAVRALDRVMGDDSEWRESWEEGGGEDALAVVRDLRSALAG
ncbi:DUF4259 domain-containing protein [Catellatospora bangladeshensis]|nr:DUF4259 domain-containing protein [Catellatospora bangladeshensis]